jgi:dipeptidyl aminopeptidase/acylaminoacyl peptidase
MSRFCRSPGSRVLFSLAASLMGWATVATPGLRGQDRTLTVDDLRLEVGVSSPQISPDGTRVVVVTSRPDYEENRFERTLVLVELATGEMRDLTPQRPGVGQPRWSPSGAYLAFVDADEESGPQVYVLPMAGGEARKITTAKEGVRVFHWSSDGAQLLFTTPDEAEEREGEERHNRSFEVGENSYLTREAPSPVHLWRVPAAGGGAERLTEGVESVSDFVVSPDGRTVALNVKPRPHTGEDIRSVIRVLELESGEQRELVGDPPVSPGDFSHDGRLLVFSRSRGPEPYFNPSGIFLQPVEGGASRDITASIDRSLGGAAWLPGGEALLVAGTDLTWQAMWIQPLEGAPRRLDLGPVHAASAPIVADNGAVAFIGREAQRASELYVMRAGDWAPRRITDFNEALAGMRLGAVETVSWDGPDGFRQNGVLVYPPDFQEGRRYPLVLNIHGGPMGTSTEALSTFNQILAAQGWLVFSPNYRGSSTQGKAFQRAVVNDAGDGPGRDVMSGVEAVKRMGIVDEDRVAVSGWSYGGYMTAWLTAHYPGWAAAVAGAAVTDWFDWYSMADMNTWAGFGLAGSPWLNDNAMNYWRQSPMAYAHQIRTPTLILSDTGDERVTVSQSYKLYHALKDNGVEVRFIAYPTRSTRGTCTGGGWSGSPSISDRALGRRPRESASRCFLILDTSFRRDGPCERSSPWWCSPSSPSPGPCRGRMHLRRIPHRPTGPPTTPFGSGDRRWSTTPPWGASSSETPRRRPSPRCTTRRTPAPA